MIGRVTDPSITTSMKEAEPGKAAEITGHRLTPANSMSFGSLLKMMALKLKLSV
jgi:hypothetical protein